MTNLRVCNIAGVARYIQTDSVGGRQSTDRVEGVHYRPMQALWLLWVIDCSHIILAASKTLGCCMTLACLSMWVGGFVSSILLMLKFRFCFKYFPTWIWKNLHELTSKRGESSWVKYTLWVVERCSQAEELLQRHGAGGSLMSWWMGSMDMDMMSPAARSPMQRENSSRHYWLE